MDFFLLAKLLYLYILVETATHSDTSDVLKLMLKIFVAMSKIVAVAVLSDCIFVLFSKLRNSDCRSCFLAGFETVHHILLVAIHE